MEKTVKLTTSRRTKQTINRWPIWCTAALVDKEYNQGAGAIPGSACSFAIIACLRLKARVIAFDDASKWYNFFEDHGGDEINPTQINAMETVRYLLEKKGQADPDWFNLSEKIINQVTRRWSVTSLENDGYVSIGEQDVDQTPYNSHTARYGSILAMYFDAGANIAYKDTAYHSLCYGLYSVENEGYTNTYFREEGYAWTTDSFGDFLFHYLEAISAIPEWAGNRNYLLKSTSTITKISYIDTTQVVYSTFDESGADKLKLTKEPVSIKVNGLNIKSYTWDNASKVLIINRLNGKHVEVSLDDTFVESSIPKILIYPNPTNGNFTVELDQRFSEGSKFEVCDFYGRIVFQKDLEVGIKHNFDLTLLQKGLYFIGIMNKNKNYFQKVLIK